MTNRNTNSLLQTITIDFGCGFGLGLFIGILCSVRVGFDFWTIIIMALTFGVVSAIFGWFFWRYLSKRSIAGFAKRMNHDVKETSDNGSS